MVYSFRKFLVGLALMAGSTSTAAHAEYRDYRVAQEGLEGALSLFVYEHFHGEKFDPSKGGTPPRNIKKAAELSFGFWREFPERSTIEPLKVALSNALDTLAAQQKNLGGRHTSLEALGFVSPTFTPLSSLRHLELSGLSSSEIFNRMKMVEVVAQRFSEWASSDGTRAAATFYFGQDSIEHLEASWNGYASYAHMHGTFDNLCLIAIQRIANRDGITLPPAFKEGSCMILKHEIRLKAFSGGSGVAKAYVWAAQFEQDPVLYVLDITTE
ncbi:hypothetical protein ROBYS_20080 [Roseobacter sp. OBYS 0001]|nr:hypothetical protein ROBYS_20080 [Roseobacter sp. OBYS 0001]